MASVTELLTSFNLHPPTANARDTLLRFLRVPEVWEALRNLPEGSVPLGAAAPPLLTPAYVTDQLLGGIRSSSPAEAGNAEPTITKPGEGPTTLQSLRESTASAAKLKQIDLDQGVEGLFSHMQSRWESYRSPLALIWDALDSSAALFRRVVGTGDEAAIHAAVNALLANALTEDAADFLQLALASQTGDLLSVLRDTGETELLTKLLEEMDVSSPYSSGRKRSDALAWEAEQAILAGSLGHAQRAFEQAYRMNQRGAALFADRLADVAALMQDSILEGEVLQTGLNLDPTSRRRARLGLCLLDRDQRAEALSLLSMNSSTLEERIATAIVAHVTGADEEADDGLNAVVHEIAEGAIVPQTWFHHLRNHLVGLGRLKDAVEIAFRNTWHTPASQEARKALAEILLKTEDFNSARTQAELARVLYPEETWPEISLAQALQGLGQAKQAAECWKKLAQLNPAFNREYGECAILAGEFDQAEAAIEGMLSADPENRKGLVLSARLQHARGNSETAQTILNTLWEGPEGYPQAALVLAEIQSAQADYSGAKRFLDRAYQSSPEDPQVAASLIEWYVSQGRPGDALEIANSTRKAAPNSVPIMLHQAELLRELGHAGESEGVLEEALKKVPGNWSVRQALAEIYEEKGKHTSAVEMIQSLPENASREVRIRAARISLKAAKELQDLELVSRTRDMLGQIDASEQPEPLLWLFQAEIYELLGDYQQSLDRYRICLRKSKELDRETYTHAAFGAARSAAEMGEPSLALSILENAHERLPESPDVLAQLADGFSSVKLHDKAIEAAKKATKLNPNSSIALRALGKALAASGEKHRAHSAFKRLAAVQPQKPENWLEMASIAASIPDRAATRSALARALQIGKKSPQVMKACAISLTQIGDPMRGLRFLKTALRLDPADRGTWETYAILSREHGDLEEAKHAWMEIATRSEGDPQTLDRSAKALWELDSTDLAKSLWEDARKADPKNPKILKSLAEAYTQLGEYENGLRLLSDALEQDPGNLELAKNTVVAALEHGDSDTAFEILSRLSSPDLEDPELGLLFLETLVERANWSRAHELLTATDFPSSHLRLALQSSVALHTGHFTEALEVYQRALDCGVLSDREALISAGIASRLGLYDIAEQFFTREGAWLGPKRELELIAHDLRVRDAAWIYHDLKAAERSPSRTSVEASAIQERFERLEATNFPPIPPEILEGLRLKWGLSNGSHMHELERSLERTLKGYPEAIDTLIIARLQGEQADAALEAIELEGYRSVWKDILHARVLEAQGRLSEARELLQASKTPPHLQALSDFLQARISLAMEEVATAVSTLDGAILAWSDISGWHSLLASIYQDRGEPEKALPHLQKAVDLNPRGGDQQLSLARVFSDCAQWKESVEAFRAAIPNYPESGNLFKEAAYTALEAGENNLAHEWFGKACELSPADPHALIGAAQSALQVGRKREAKDFATSALRLAPEDPEVLRGFGDLLSSQGKYETAMQAYERALDHAPECIPLVRARSKALLAMDRSTEAVGELQKLAESDPADPEAWHFLALAAESAGALEEADAAATKAIKLAPINPEYHLTLGRICRAKGQLDRALDELTHASSLADTESRIALEIGRVCEDRHEFERALDAYQSVITTNPESFEAYFRAGMILRSKKDYPLAGGMLKRAVEINPLDRNALHQLAAVRALELIHGRVATSRINT